MLLPIASFLHDLIMVVLLCCFFNLFSYFLQFEGFCGQACCDMAQAAMRAGSAAWEVALKAIVSSSTPDCSWSGVEESL
jgi:hypothetical protein